MKKIFKTTLLFVLIVTLCVGLIGCDFVNDILGNTENNQGDSTTNDAPPPSGNTAPIDIDQGNTNPDNVISWNYTIIEEEGQHYIVFEDPAVYEYEGQQQLASVQFNSLTEFKESVTNNKLSASDKEIVATFERDEVGILTPDFNNLFEPDIPNDCTIGLISWEGIYYSFGVSTSSEAFGFITGYSQEKYNEIFQEDFENYFDQDTIISITEIIETDDGKTIATYRTSMAELKNIRYTILVGNKTIVVDERYTLANEWLPTSDTVPSRITLYITQNDRYSVMMMHSFEEKPSEEWLSKFGMHPYVETGVAEK